MGERMKQSHSAALTQLDTQLMSLSYILQSEHRLCRTNRTQFLSTRGRARMVALCRDTPERSSIG